MTTKGPATVPNKSVFKIRRKSDGLYSKGGSTPRFSKLGKTWTSKAALGSHLTLLMDRGGWKVTPETMQQRLVTAYGDCEIYEYTVVIGSAMAVTDYEAMRHV